MSVEIKKLDNGITRLVISSGRGNPLTPAVVQKLNEAMDQLLLSPPKALIIDAAGSPIFSGGFALPIIASWDREQLSTFFSQFLDILHKILAISAPTITVLEGHAIAGGFILSLSTDFRIIGMGKAKYGLSEVNLGVSVPAGAGVLFEWRTSPKDALALSTTGELISGQKALDIGYAHYRSENPMECAMELAKTLVQKPGFGVAKTRQFFNHRISKAMREADTLFMEEFLDTWFSEEGQKCIQTLAQKLSKKRAK